MPGRSRLNLYMGQIAKVPHISKRGFRTQRSLVGVCSCLIHRIVYPAQDQLWEKSWPSEAEDIPEVSGSQEGIGEGFGEETDLMNP